jgi:hypothetical protein
VRCREEIAGEKNGKKIRERQDELRLVSGE